MKYSRTENYKKYFLKDKKALVYVGINENRVTNYYPLTEEPVWCFTKQTSQEWNYYAGVSASNESRLFVFNKNQIYTSKMLIVYQGKQYTVSRCDRENDYDSDVFIYAQTQNVLKTVCEYDPEKIANL